jgi:hypothetical protein
MAKIPSESLEQMTEAEVRAWKGWLLEQGRQPRAFVWDREARNPAESEYNYESALDKVIETSAEGKRYIVGVRGAELQRLQELKDEGRSDLLPSLRPLTSR